MKQRLLYSLLVAGLVFVTPPIFAQENLGPEFAALKAQYDAKVKTDVQQAYDAAIVDLNVKYTASLDRALESAQKAGKLDEALALKSEKEAIATGKGVSAKDAEKIEPVLKQVRDLYRASASRIEVDRAKRLQPLQATFSKSLDSVISHLTTQGKLEEASAVKRYRDDLGRPVPPPAVLGRAPSSGTPTSTASSKNSVATQEQLIAKKWVYHSPSKTGIWTFNPDKTMISTSGFGAKWSIKGRTLHLDWGKNNLSQFSLELQPSSGDLILRGMDSAGKPIDSTLTQVTK